MFRKTVSNVPGAWQPWTVGLERSLTLLHLQQLLLNPPVQTFRQNSWRSWRRRRRWLPSCRDRTTARGRSWRTSSTAWRGRQGWSTAAVITPLSQPGWDELPTAAALMAETWGGWGPAPRTPGWTWGAVRGSHRSGQCWSRGPGDQGETVRTVGGLNWIYLQ